METLANKRPRETDENQLQPPAKRKAIRKRAALACEECRMRKRRCDGATPACGGCRRRMSECVYSSELQEKAWHNSMIQSLRNRLEELERANSERNIVTTVSGLVSPITARAPEHLSPSTRQHVLPPPPVDVGVNQPLAGHGSPHFETTSSVTSPPTDEAHSNSLEYPSMGGASGHETGTSPSRGLRPCSIEKLMKPIDQAIDPGRTHPEPETNWPDGLCPRVNTSALNSCSCDSIVDSMRWCLPLRRHADGLVALYFSRVHKTYPVLHQRTFMRQYEKLWRSSSSPRATRATECPGLCKQRSQGKTFPAMVNAVFALASLFESGPPEQNSIRADPFFRRAQEIDLLDIINEEVGIELVQLLLLLGFYLQSTEKFSKCWNITGLVIRMAQNMGLQLSPSEARKRGLSSCGTQLECEMRIRVWYGCVLLDREISMSFGRPLMIVPGSEGLRLPEAIDDNLLSDEPGKWNTQPKDLPSLMEAYIQTIKLYDILGKVLDREHLRDSTTVGPQPGTSAEGNAIDTRSLLNLDTMIMEWRDALPTYLQYDPTSELQPEEALTMDGLAIPTADLLGQAKRLHTRFLNVRILILRPALEQLFQKQHHKLPNRIGHSMVARVQDLMLSNIAAQCILSADNLVRFLGSQIRAQSLVAWWYNISYLHTCGSTLLMGQLCSLNESAVPSDSLSSSWDLCLQCLSRYTSLSSNGKKSFHLLQESAKRLLPQNIHPPTQAQNPLQTNQDLLVHSHSLTTDPIDLERIANSRNEMGETEHLHANREANENHLPVIPETDFENGNFDGGLWPGEQAENSYWSFMPFLSQLETLPTDFDPSILE